MKTLSNTATKRELIDLGAVIQNDAAYINGSVYRHECNDYQEGAGNHDDYRLFRLVTQAEREPFFGGVRYYGTDGHIVLEMEYPAPMTESGADSLIKKGLSVAASEGVFVYLLGCQVSLK